MAVDRGGQAFAYFAIAGVFLVGFVWAGVYAALDPIEFAAWAVRREVLLGMLGVNIAVGLFRMVAVVDAHAGGGGRPISIGLVAALLFVAVPHAGLGWVQVRSYEALTSVFQASPEPPPLVAATTSTSTTSTTIASSSVVGSQPPEPTTTTAPETTTTVEAPGPSRLTVLLLGSDAGPYRSGVRTDTVMVVSLDTTTGDLAIFGLPRNLSGLAFPDGLEVPGIFNTVYGFGAVRPDRFTGVDPGASAMIEMSEHITGLDIDHYVMVDMLSFVDVVDALGGVTMYVPVAVFDELYETDRNAEPGINFPVGFHEFDGSDALAYVRTRRYSSDYSRMARQRCLVAAMADQLEPAGLLRGLPKLLTTFQENVDTDIPFDALPDLIRLLGVVDMENAIAVGFTPPDWTIGGTRPDIPKIREAVQLAITDPAAAVELFGVEETGSSCGPA